MENLRKCYHKKKVHSWESGWVRGSTSEKQGNKQKQLSTFIHANVEELKNHSVEWKK